MSMTLYIKAIDHALKSSMFSLVDMLCFVCLFWGQEPQSATYFGLELTVYSLG